MPSDTELVRLATVHQQHQIDLSHRVAHTVDTAWRTFGGLTDAAMKTFVDAVVPIVSTAITSSVMLTDAQLAQYCSYATGDVFHPQGIDPATIDYRDGAVDIPTVYERPVVAARVAISEGKTFTEAMAAGRTRAMQLADNDAQLAARATANDIMEQIPRVQGYRRVPDANACIFCLLASTQRYHVGQLMPMHPGCHCSVVPIIGTKDPGHVINKPLLKQIKEMGGVKPKIGITNHPELGPTLGPATAPKTKPVEPPKPGPHRSSVDVRDLVEYAGKGAREKFSPTMDRLAEIHGAPHDSLAKTVVVAGGKSTSKGGHFSPGKRPGKPKRTSGKTVERYLAELKAWREAPLIPEIRVNDRGDGTGLLSFLHEYGHRIDYIPGTGGLWNRFVSQRVGENPAMAAFIDQAKATPTIANASRSFRDYSYVTYFRSNEEIWARAYSQWAAQKLGGPELAALRATQKSYSTYQWPDDEFTILTPMIESVLRERKLLT